MSFTQARFPTQSLRGTSPAAEPGAQGTSSGGSGNWVPYVVAAVGMYFLLRQTAQELTPPAPRRFAR